MVEIRVLDVCRALKIDMSSVVVSMETAFDHKNLIEVDQVF